MGRRWMDCHPSLGLEFSYGMQGLRLRETCRLIELYRRGACPADTPICDIMKYVAVTTMVLLEPLEMAVEDMSAEFLARDASKM